MGRIACAMVVEAAAALERRDAAAAWRVVAGDGDLDRLQARVDGLAVRIVALRQPVAGYLRRVIGAMRTAGDLERVGDLAASIAKRTEAAAAMPGPGSLLAGARRLAEAPLGMLARALAAFRRGTRRRRGRSGRRMRRSTANARRCSARCSPTSRRSRARSASGCISPSASRTSSGAAITPPTSPRQ
jgi:hypothetical protein